MIKIKYVTIPDRNVTLIDYEGSIGDFLVDTFKPGDAFSVYAGTPCLENDITLKILEGVDSTVSEYTVADTPSAGLTAAGWLSVISIVISVAAIALAPKPKIPGTINRDQESPNNALGARSNQARPLQRVPDIKGTVKSIPDVIMPPYFKYQDLRTRVEHGYYCVGRKQLQIENIKDGDTPISLIEGASARVYYPYNSPNSGAPDIQIGDFIDLPIVTPYRSNEVDGIALPPEQDVGATPIIFDYYSGSGIPPDGTRICRLSGITATDFNLDVQEFSSADWICEDYYAGNSVVLESFNMGFGVPLDISGTYEIISVTALGSNTFRIKLTGAIDAAYSGAYASAAGNTMYTVFSTPFNQWYYMTRADVENGYVNITAPNGMYRDTGGANLLALTVYFWVEVEPVDADGLPSGASMTYESSLSGNSTIKRGITVEFALPYATRFRCRVRRTTSKFALSGTIVDEIKLEDLYGLADVALDDFGDVTTIQTKTIATPFATAVKDRQLNCTATEMVYYYFGNGLFNSSLTPNETAVQSYIADFIDPVLGNRPLSELDADGLLAMEAAIATYFGSVDYCKFDFTLDSTDITFQEYTQMLFNAIFSVAYREGSVVKAHFERSVSAPAMLFTHRSKTPQSETYSRNFNLSQLSDGVEFKWIDPDTDTQEVIYIPADKSAVNPKKFEMAGFRNYDQAYKRAWREYNKILHEKVTIDFEATADARYVKPGDVISVVKGTRTNTADGEVLSVSVDGFTLTLSQDVTFVLGDTHSIILKKDDGTCEAAIICTAGAASNQVVLSVLPNFDIRTSIDYQRRTEFSFGNDDRMNAQLFIARSIDTGSGHTVQIKGVNYTDAYYANDDANLTAFSSGFSSGFS